MRIDGGLISAHLWRVSTVFAALSVAPEFRNTRVYARASLKSHGRWWPIAADRYGEYALLLAFLQAPARSVRRRVLQSSCQPPNLVAGRRLEFRNTRAYARASLKSHRRWLAHRDSRRDRAANRLDHVTLTPGAAALAVAPIRFGFSFGKCDTANTEGPERIFSKVANSCISRVEMTQPCEFGGIPRI